MTKTIHNLELLVADNDDRNNQLDNKLCLRGLQAMDVSGDGNYLFRSVSLSINGTKDSHDALHQLVATQIELHGDTLSRILEYSFDDGLSFEKHVEKLQTNGVADSVDAMRALAKANVCNREIYVYIA